MCYINLENGKTDDTGSRRFRSETITLDMETMEQQMHKPEEHSHGEDFL